MRLIVTAVFGLVLLLFMRAGGLLAGEMRIGVFAELPPADGLPEAWQPMTFRNMDRHTQYTLTRDQDRTVIRAHSQNAASGLIRHLRVDPVQYPLIRWHWKIKRVLEKGDLSTKQGDDYAARIYVAFAFDPEAAGWWEWMRHRSASLFANPEVPGTALNYIWANKAPGNTIAPNPYAPEAMMIVLQSGNAAAGRWMTETRDIVADYRRAFGRPPPPIIGIGLMTDTDNTGEETTAYYGDITLLEADHSDR
jgi:hypothetical protein